MLRFLCIGLCLICGPLWPQDADDVVTGEIADIAAIQVSDPELISVPVEMVNQSWFTDRVGTALIHFETEVEEPDSFPRGVAGLSITDIEVQATPDSKLGKSTAVVRFLLRRAGVVTFPALDFLADGRVYRSLPQQIIVGEPVESDAMTVTLTPAKRRVYVGEPLRVNLSWRCNLEAGRLQALNYYPKFFNDSAVKIVIPRNTAPDNRQVGLPIGGRRVIATKTVGEAKSKNLGTLELPLYLSISEPGIYVLPSTRLECAYLAESIRNFGQYAAHFNNELFAPEDANTRYERFYAETEAIEIEVLPLPELGRLSEFSGLFTPVRVEVSVKPREVVVGELMQVEVQVFSDAPHGMIEFPEMNRQSGLRGRFLLDDQLDRLWRADGTTFRARVRALTTDVAAFPGLRIQTFDTECGEYAMLSTDPVPLSVASSDGQNFIDVSSYAGTQVSLVNQPEGVWHNLEANVMNDLFNKLVVALASWFWLLVLLGPLVFLLLLPFVRERRRRALDAHYRARIEAFLAFKKLPEKDSGKWAAFLQFLAVSFHSGKRAWTIEDSQRALESIGASEEDVEQILALHGSMDAEEFHPEHPQASLGNLNGIGKRVLQLIRKSALVLLLCGLAWPTDGQASDWVEAEVLFEQAMTAQAGSESAVALYAESALKFQTVAESGERPGEAWYNAGNAWFKTGALGRSIAAYRQAWIYRPFDSLLQDNLRAARALVLNDVPVEGNRWLDWPVTWLKALLVIVGFVFFGVVLVFLRYRKRRLLIISLLLGVLALSNLALLIHAWKESGRHGVVIMDEVFARKGPAYSYAKAFNEPLHDGLEFSLIEARGEWGLIALSDGRQCWVPLNQTQLLQY